MIRVQPIDGTWQRLGADLYPGVMPADVAPTWGAQGPESLAFTLMRPPGRVHADLMPYTPVELYATDDASSPPVWAGYTLQAPPGAVNEPTTVTCLGWHHYREDDPQPAVYLIDDLAGFVDARSVPTEDLVTNHAAGEVTTGGSIVLGWRKDTIMPAALRRAAVMLDLGDGVAARRVLVDFEIVGTSAVAKVGLQLADLPNNGGVPAGQWESPTSVVFNSGTVGFDYTSTAPLGRRYVQIFAEYNGAGTLGNDVLVRITRVRVATADAYISSTFTADVPIKEARDRMCPLLSPDNSRIVVPTTSIPSLAWVGEDVTARQVHDAANDYHGYRLGVDELRRVFFQPQPSRPRLEVDARARGVRFRDQSTNDGTELYNKVTVRGRSGSGEALKLVRFLSDYAPEVTFEYPAGVAATNPGFDTVATGWTGAPNALTRQTTDFQSSPAAGEVTTWTGAETVTATLTGSGTFKAGRTYRFSVWLRANGTPKQGFVGPLPASCQVTIRAGSSSDYVEATLGIPGSNGTSSGYGAWTKCTVVWVPRVDVAPGSVTWRIQKAMNFGTASVLNGMRVDDLAVSEIRAGLLGRRGRVRAYTLDVAAPTDLTAMDGLAKAFLLAHRTVPLKGSLSVSGARVYDLESGRPVSADRLGPYTGEMIRVKGVPDPDTGDLQARDGIIASVNGLEPASLALDTERRSLEALLFRMGVVRA